MARPPFTVRLRRFRKMLGSIRAKQKGDLERAIELIDQAGQLWKLSPSERVTRARLLMGAGRFDDAHRAFDALRQEFKGSDDPDLQYLRHYCTARLSLMQRSSGQWSYEAKQAKAIKCRRRIKGMFPMVTVDEIHERIKPRR